MPATPEERYCPVCGRRVADIVIGPYCSDHCAYTDTDGFDRYAQPLLVPVEGREGKRARPADKPLRTCTARNETGVVVPPYIVELRGGGSTHRPASSPLATVCASGNHHGLTYTTVDRHGLLQGGAARGVEDLRFRMLAPDEYAAAMAFPVAVDDRPYVWLGTKRERVRLAGNAVTPPAARDLLACISEAVLGHTYDRTDMDLAV